MVEQAKVLITSTSRISEAFKPFEPVIDKPETNPNENKPPEPSNKKVSSTILPVRAQREERLRK